MLPMTLENLQKVKTIVHRTTGEVSFFVGDYHAKPVNMAYSNSPDKWSGEVGWQAIMLVVQMMDAITGKKFVLKEEREGNKIYAPD